MRPHPRRRATLYWRLFVPYALVMTLALALLVFAPVTISVPVTAAELVGLLAAVSS